MSITAVKNKDQFSKRLLYGAVIISAVFILTRLIYFIYYPVVNVSEDSASYIAVALKLLQLSPPLLDMRTPGYPFFLTLVFLLSKNFILIYIFQSLATIGSALFLYKVLCKYFTQVALFFAAAIAVFISSTFYLVLEFSVLSETIFICFLMLCSSFLIASLINNRTSDWIWFSVTASVVILIRPAGLFLVPVLIFILIFFFINKYNYKSYLGLLLPLSLFIFSLCAYNYLTIKRFTLSPAGDLSFFATTILYMEESPEYPPEINNAIRITLDSIPKKEKAYVKDPKEIKKLFRIFNDNLFRSWRFVGLVMKDNSMLTYMDIQPYLVKITKDAIRRNPEVYARILLSNLYQFVTNISEEMQLFSQLSRSYQRIYIDNYYVNVLKDDQWDQFYSDNSSAEGVIKLYEEQVNDHGSFEYVIYSNGTVMIQETLMKKLYEYYEKACNFLFRNIVWEFIFLLTFLLSVYRVIKTQFRDPFSFIPFLFGIMFIMNGLFISGIGISITRYSYTVEFILYFSLPFLIYLLKNNRTENKIKI